MINLSMHLLMGCQRICFFLIQYSKLFFICGFIVPIRKLESPLDMYGRVSGDAVSGLSPRSMSSEMTVSTFSSSHGSFSNRSTRKVLSSHTRVETKSSVSISVEAFNIDQITKGKSDRILLETEKATNTQFNEMMKVIVSYRFLRITCKVA